MGHQVPVILVEHVDSLGHKGQELAVKPGFARNFLVPKRMAVYATEETRSKFKVVLPTEEEERVTQIRQRNLLKTAVEQTKLTFLRATTDGVKLYGSVSMTDLKEAIDKSSLGLAITEEDIRLPSGERVIKEVGQHPIEVQVAPGLWVKSTAVVQGN